MYIQQGNTVCACRFIGLRNYATKCTYVSLHCLALNSALPANMGTVTSMSILAACRLQAIMSKAGQV